jgi:hypothetical protein
MSLPATLFADLALVAERSRWRMEDVPWGAFELSRATPVLRALAKEMAFSEQATFSATQRFMHSFAEDVDFTQWLSVWFYEETRHPHVLLRWLALAGDTFDGEFILRGRVSAPFIKSRLGTLVLNVISEVTAAAAYLALADSAPEPLLMELSRRIASDEARHAASFYSYARRWLERAEEPLRERLDVVKVLHLWLNETQNVTHPVNQMMQKAQALESSSGVRTDLATLQTRICRILGGLTDLPLHVAQDVQPLMSQLAAQVHAGD